MNGQTDMSKTEPLKFVLFSCLFGIRLNLPEHSGLDNKVLKCWVRVQTPASLSLHLRNSDKLLFYSGQFVSKFLILSKRESENKRYNLDM